MGVISKGILGPISGKVGTVIGSNWKGITYLRSLPARSKRTPSALQVNQREKFMTMAQLLQPMGDFLNVGFKNYAKEETPRNSALSYNLKNAISGVYPALVINYNLLLVSRGDLPGAQNALARSMPTGSIQFDWANNSGIGKASADDLAMALIYCPDRKQAIYTTAGTTRASSMLELMVYEFSGLVVHTYLTFISADAKSVATSVYCGEVVVA